MTGLQQRAIRAVLRYRYGHSSGQTAITKARSEHPYWLGGRKGIRPVKNLGGCGDGSPLVSVGVAPIGTVGAFRLHYLPLAPQKSRTTMMAYYKNDGLDPVGAPTCLRKQEVGKPSRNAAQPCAVYDDPSGVMSCGTAGPFGSVPGTWTH